MTKKLMGRAATVIGLVLALCGGWMYLSHAREDVQWNSGMGGAAGRVFGSLDESAQKSIEDDFRFQAALANSTNADLRRTGMILGGCGTAVLLVGLVMLAEPRGLRHPSTAESRP